MFTLHMLNTWHLFLLSLQWKAEIQDFCPSTRILLIGCKTDLRTDVCTRMELSNQKQTPISHEQVCSMNRSSSVCLFRFPSRLGTRRNPPFCFSLLRLTCFTYFFFTSQGSSMAKQVGAEAYLECSAFTSEKSIHSVFRTAALACMNKLQPANKPSPIRRLSKRLLHLPSKTELLSSTFSKDKSKSCSIMWILLRSCWG